MTQNVKCPKTDESKRVTLFLEDESEMSHQEGLDVFQIRKQKSDIRLLPCICPGLSYFRNQGIILSIDNSEFELLDF